MTTIKEDLAPYRSLGRYLRLQREELGHSASEFWRKNQSELGIVYGRYAAIERGESLPEPETLCRIARALGLNERVALLQWVSVQITNTEHQEFFLSLTERAQNAPVSPGYVIRSNSIPPSEFDNTWVLGPQDHEALLDTIELLDFLVMLETCWPQVQTPQDLGFDTQSEWDAFRENHLTRWLNEGRIVLSEGGIQLVLPHFHIPKTDLWLDVRKRIVNRFVADALPQLTPEALKAKRVFRTFTTRVLTPSQVEALIDQLPQVEKSFFGTPLDSQADPTERKSYSLLILLAERHLKSAGRLLKAKKPRKKSRG